MTKAVLPVLYSFRRCPYAMRARMSLVYSEITVEIREIELKNKPQEFLNLSQKATVPVLILPNHDILDESLDIIYWALSKQDKNHWLDLSCEQKKSAHCLIQENDTKFKENLDKYKYSSRFPEFPESYYRQQGENYLSKLNLILKNKQYLTANTISYADIAIAPFIRQFANVNKQWFDNSSYTYLILWLENILNLTIFKQAMKKFPIWNQATDKCLFP